MGFSKTNCETSSMDATRTLQLSCNTGKITNLVDWGLTTQIEDPLLCITKPESLCKDLLANLFFDTEFKKKLFE